VDVSGQLHAPSPVLIGLEAEWAPEPVWMRW